MDTREFSRNPLTGVRRVFHGDPMTGDFVIEEIQDIEPIKEANQTIRNNRPTYGQFKFDPKAFMHLVASIPGPVFYELKRKGILGSDGYTILDEKAFTKWLLDRDNSHFRTHDGSFS